LHELEEYPAEVFGSLEPDLLKRLRHWWKPVENTRLT